MKYCFPITLLLLLQLTSIAQKTRRNNKSIETIRLNTIQKDYKNLLILGSGNMASRKFIHDIIYELNKRLKEDDISYKYEYLGTEEAEINENLQKTVRANKHDAILIITPQNSTIRSFWKGNYILEEIPKNEKDAYLNNYGERLLEKVDIQITEDLNSEPIWKALLQTNVSQDAQKVFAIISRNLIAEMKKNKLIATRKK